MAPMGDLIRTLRDTAIELRGQAEDADLRAQILKTESRLLSSHIFRRAADEMDQAATAIHDLNESRARAVEDLRHLLAGARR